MNKILLKIFIIDKDLNEDNIENINNNKSMKIYNKEKVELVIKDNIK